MPRGVPASQTVPAVIILGADAVFAALPATPVQLAHACQRLGYASAFPASWGDELVADACLRELSGRGDDPAILCACPNVRERLTRTGDDLAPWMISLVAPPVAVARYLRSAYGARVLHITYAGACPGAHDPSIDEQVSPGELLALCRERGVSPAAMPHLFEGVIPPDRRRSVSMPGGAPSDQALRDFAGGRQLAELSSEDALTELANHLIARAPVLVDLAPHVGCACSGIGDAVGGGDERRDLIALEPPRSLEPVIDSTVLVDVAMPAPAGDGGARRVSAPVAAVGAAAGAPATAAPRRTSLPALPPLEEIELSHAVIREYPNGDAARRSPILVRRRPPSDTPAAQLEGINMPRAYLGKRPRRKPARRSVAAQEVRRGRSDRERTIDRAAEVADGRRGRRTPRSNIIPISVEPPSPVPPPPAKRKPGTVLGIGGVIALAVSVATAFGASV